MQTILLVEDEAIIALNKKITLEKYGFSVLTAGSGEKAIEMVDTNEDINLILMDIDLGRSMDGTEAASQILKKHDVPLIFISSHTEREIVEKTDGITSYGYIVKTAGETVMLASIKMAFRLFEARQKEKEKEIALIKERRLLKTIIDYSSALIWHKDKNGAYLQVNKAYCEAYEIRESQIIGKTVFDLYPRGEARQYEAEDQEVISKNKPLLGIQRLITLPSDKEIWTLIDKYPYRDIDGKIAGIIGFALNITDQKGYEDRMNSLLKEKENLIRDLRS